MNNNAMVTEVSDIANLVLESQWDITSLEALQLAVKIQHNKILSEAYMTGIGQPSTLEAIAMELGASSFDTKNTIKDALQSIASGLFSLCEKED